MGFNSGFKGLIFQYHPSGSLTSELTTPPASLLVTQILTYWELRISHVLGLCQCPEDSSSNSNNNNENASSKKRSRRWIHSNIGFVCSKVDTIAV